MGLVSRLEECPTGITDLGKGENARKVVVYMYSDSDWAVRRSTTGHHTNLAMRISGFGSGC